MLLYYQCECGKKIFKLAADSGNSYEEDKDLFLHHNRLPVVKCPKCSAKYKIKKPSIKIMYIAGSIGLIAVVALRFTLYINLFIALGIVCGAILIVTALMMLFDDYFEKVTDENDAREA